ncbi:MAG: peptide chain release factor N(5)-glutamine methyltransferase [Oscillospiraceae bacterium]|jgi:release factor glutamine methyltransferase|nr:peptide chain release factor N(5)-glutamine methyltransferase [Oscillospiraceae bacterium]
MTYRQLYQQYRHLGDLTARRLLCFASLRSPAELLRGFDDSVSAEIAETFGLCARRALAGEHEAYITGEWEFFGLPLFITPAVLIPRVDTEEIVSKSLELLRGIENARVLDLCCGSGCIGIAIAKQLSCELTAVDISAEALKLTRRNAALNNVKIRTLKCNALTENPYKDEHFDLLVSNPPYLLTSEIETLDKSVRDYEPRLALDGGNDGLAFYRAIARLWSNCAENIVVECAIAQVSDVERILPGAVVVGTGTIARSPT